MKRMVGPQYLWWVDCEMTGLDPEIDKLLEVAYFFTTIDGSIISPTKSFVISCPLHDLEAMNEWCQKQHRISGLYDEVVASTITLADVEQELVADLAEYSKKGTVHPAGNSVYQDIRFILKYLPGVASLIHYRLLDVSAFRLFLAYGYMHDDRIFYKKGESHRATEDIHESLHEYLHYQKNFLL